MLNIGKIVLFDKVKYFKYIKPLGSGGTGDTHLFEDKTTNTLFAIKKYVPKAGNDIDEIFDRFVQEVKILFALSHKNIVRIFNHYLYPEHKTGYLQMEYIEGSHIDKFTPQPGKDWNDIFYDVVEAFNYLETHKILHRDIRPANILIDLHGTAKIIDFGFGKKLNTESSVGDSVFLNWPVSNPPHEVVNEGIYNHQTEIFFLGKLFINLAILNKDKTFRYSYIINKMSENMPSDRYKSFSEILSDISTSEFTNLNFTREAKSTYQNFASSIVNVIANFKEDLNMERETHKILSSLADAIRMSCLEDFFQDNSNVIRCFVKQKYAFYNYPKIEVDVAKKFFELFLEIKEQDKQILLDNLKIRLGKIKIQKNGLDDVPF
jgi:serine/threonine-protein kinase